jgi:hypothetical protein
LKRRQIMASQITVLNFTENEQFVNITTGASGAVVVASGMLGVGQTSGFTVPNSEEVYNVYFFPQGASGYLIAAGVAPNSQVGVSITGGEEEEEEEAG